jgi:hypothetical protein
LDLADSAAHAISCTVRLLRPALSKYFLGSLFSIPVIYVLLAGTTLCTHIESSSMYRILIFRVVGRRSEDDIPASELKGTKRSTNLLFYQ